MSNNLKPETNVMPKGMRSFACAEVGSLTNDLRLNDSCLGSCLAPTHYQWIRESQTQMRPGGCAA